MDNQAQILRPHFFGLSIRGEGTMAEPHVCLEALWDALILVFPRGIYRAKKRRAEPSKTTQRSHPSHHSASLLFRQKMESQRGNRKNRHDLLQAVADGTVRKACQIRCFSRGSTWGYPGTVARGAGILNPITWQPVRCRKVFSNLYL